MSLQVTGILVEFLPQQTGSKKDGSGNWIKQNFLVETDAQYNKLYCFEVFGDEKVQNLTKYQKEGDTVTVEFNVNTNEHNGNFYTTLSAWKITKVNSENNTQQENYKVPDTAINNLGSDGLPDLPF